MEFNHLDGDVKPFGLPNFGQMARDHVARRGRERVLAAVQNAIKNDKISLVYQPVVYGRDAQKVVYYEGLIRVPDKRGRLIPAAQFMPLVEDTPQGRILDCIALRLGLEALKAEPNLCLAINMSARSIDYPDWMAELNRGLAGDETLARRLIIEITEASAMSAPTLARAFMHDLRGRGISFALDDFGAGNTSFGYFRTFRFDIVKIDGQFIRNIHKDTDNQVLLAALCSLAQHFNMFTVAEQVETQAEAEFLRDCNVDCMQGYYFAHPHALSKWNDCEFSAFSEV